MDPHYAALGFTTDDSNLPSPLVNDLSEHAETVFWGVMTHSGLTLPESIAKLRRVANDITDDACAAADHMGSAVLGEMLLAESPETMQTFWQLVMQGANPFTAIQSVAAQSAAQSAARHDSDADEGDSHDRAAVGSPRTEPAAGREDTPTATGRSEQTPSMDAHYAGLGIAWKDDGSIANGWWVDGGYIREVFNNGPNSTLTQAVAAVRRKAEEFGPEDTEAAFEYMGWAVLGDQLLAESPDIMDAFWVLVLQGFSPFKAVAAAAAAATPRQL